MPPRSSSPSFAFTFTRILVPLAIQNLFTSLIGMAEVVMVGQLGDASVAAVGLAGQFFYLLNITLFGIAGGTAIFAAQYWGARDLANLRRAFGLCLLTCLAVTLAFAGAALVLPGRVIGLFTQDPAVIRLGASYLQIIGWSYVFSAVTMAFAALIRSTGNTRPPMLVGVVTLCLNIVLDYVLIFGKLGMPALGVRGSASGTAICRGLECLALVLVTYGRRLPVAASPRQLFSFDRAFAARHLRLIVVVFLNEFFWALGTNVYNAMMARLGTAAYAAYNISATFQTLGLFFSMGCTNTCGILAGHQIGAGKPEAAYRIAWRILIICVLGTGLIGLTLAAARQPLLDLYRVSPLARQNASAMLLITGLALGVRALDGMLIVGILRGGGDTQYGAFLDIGGTWLAGIPAMALAGFVLHLPAPWVLAAMLAENLFKDTLAFRRFLTRRWIRNLARPAGEELAVG
jgi:putative MATE family efflux protein